jgi:macrodomain Ter protein organizer (MatP/YcbG family)
MFPQGRSQRGRFASKSAEHREVRSLRLTDTTWEKLGDAANSRCITRADLVEQLVESGALDQEPTSSGVSLQQVEELIAQIIDDPEITRHGKDRGSVKRALQALLNLLS